MGTLYVREFDHVARDALGRSTDIPCEPAVFGEALTTSTTSGLLTTLQAETRFLVLYPSEAMTLEAGGSGTTPEADADSRYLPATPPMPIIVGVEPGTVLAVKDVA